MGLTGGVKSHRLSGQISPYCEKKRHWLCAYCAPMFLHVAKIKILQVTGLHMLIIPFAWTSVDSTRVSGRKAFLALFFPN